MEDSIPNKEEGSPQPSFDYGKYIYDIFLIALLVLGFVLRTTGLNWDEGNHLHPDERFLTGVETALIPVESLSDYWNTEISTLNPNNQGAGYFVYGTLPIFIVRYAAEILQQTGYSEITLLGRQLSALADLGVVFLVYMIAAHLYNRRAALLAAAFSTFTVLQIQISHYFVVDNFLNVFTLLAIYFAVRISTGGDPDDEDFKFRFSHFIWFGVGLGLAVSSKVSTAPVAVLLPLAVVLRLAKMPPTARRDDLSVRAFVYMIAAAAVSFLTFRIFHPYAFMGPGFFNIRINKAWLDNLRSIASQSAGNIDWPPSIQWARIPVWFSGQNLVLWGVGLPMGIAAGLGFLWASFQAFKGKWEKHGVIWFWTAAYFIWQSTAFNPTMRYQLPIYPMLAVFAGWGVSALWDKAASATSRSKNILRAAAWSVGGLSLGLTALYAFAFITIYQRPVTRVQASHWIYKNIPGPLNLHIDTGVEVYNQPMPFPYGSVIHPDRTYVISFAPNVNGELTEISLKHYTILTTRRLAMTIEDIESSNVPLSFAAADVDFNSDEQIVTRDTAFVSSAPITLYPQREYLIRIALEPGQNEVILHSAALKLLSPDGVQSLALVDEAVVITSTNPFETTFTVDATFTQGELIALFVDNRTLTPEDQRLQLTVTDGGTIVAQAETLLKIENGRGEGASFFFDEPLELIEGKLYQLSLDLLTDGGGLTLLGSVITIETGWDDPLPLRVDGYDGYGGIYQLNQNFNMEWDANLIKLQHMLDLLDKADYISISSSRQWASIPRIPERFPILVTYYRELIGCPDEYTIEYCYNIAEPGMFEGNLGFELVQTFQSDPTLGPFSINDQPSEEAFTVYDHPKSFIFQKTEDYDHQKATDILTAVDLTNVIRLTPKDASEYDPEETEEDIPSLLLPADRLETQRAGGTWSDLFDYESFVNRYQIVTVIIWYLALGVLGLAAYPLVRKALPGLPDKGYPLGRTFGLLLLSYLSWLGGSLGLTFSRGWITFFYFLIFAAGAALVIRNWETYKQDWKTHRRYYILIESLFLAFFIISLLVRLGNPDLWHPFKGGEKPMDFAYFNAVLKSATFPAYDPWFSGGYINYYYYGFVFVGSLVKMLGIAPSIAYNLIIPTLFAFLSMGAFSVGWNLFARKELKEDGRAWDSLTNAKSPLWVGLAAGLGTSLLGNLGTIRMIFVGYQRIGSDGAYDITANFFTRVGWMVSGMFKALSGQALPYGLGDWYWIPSRVIPAPNDVEPITEFPWFTTIYADLHAHMMALPITILVIAWVVSAARGRAWKGRGIWWTLWSFFFAGLAIGALRPTNTWDFPTYLALALAGTAYAVLRFYQAPEENKVVGFIGKNGVKALVMGGAVGLLGLLSFKLFQPFVDWYAVGYTTVRLWPNELTSQTPVESYFVHWGLFLFVLFTWLVWETRQWLANTPLSSLRKLAPYRFIIQITILVLAAVVIFMLTVWDINTIWISIPLAVWCTVLLFRPDMPEAKRVVLFMVGTSLFLTIMVEVIVLSGDIGRMNTVFKFYLQAWVLFAISAAAAFGWVLSEIEEWRPGWRNVWIFSLAVIVFLAALFPLFGTYYKIADRMTPDAPRSLDGMDYMLYSVYNDQGTLLDLSQDYYAIRWMQENVIGSPVIVEGYAPNYRWGARFANYTGLPAVLGWDWHQIQQRVAGPPGVVESRRNGVNNFYQTADILQAKTFLETFDVSYIILGQMEQAYYPGIGLGKFEQQEGVLWESVYDQGGTIIYKVIKE